MASAPTRSTSASAEPLSGGAKIAQAAARSLPAPTSAAAIAYVALLNRRFAALEEAARGQVVGARALGLGSKERAVTRRVLRPLEARWHDGDENLVRGILDRWHAPDAAAGGKETAARLLQAGAELMRISARAEAWWFFLWEMESILGLVSHEGGC